MAFISTLTDNFNTAGAFDATKWSFSNLGLNGTASQAGGVLVLDANDTVAFDGECHLTSVNAYDMTGDGAYMKVVSISSDGTKTWSGVRVMASANIANDYLDMFVDDTNSLVILGVGGGTAIYGTNYTFSGTTHAWWRIRESGGTFFWDTATSSASNPPISTDWTNRGSTTVASLGWTGSKTSVKPKFYFRLVATASVHPTAQWDGFNTSAGASTASYNVAITETAALSNTTVSSLAWTVSRTEVATLTSVAVTGASVFVNLTETAALSQTSSASFAYASAITEGMTLSAVSDAVRVYFGDVIENAPLSAYSLASQFWVTIDTGSGVQWTQIDN